MQGLLLGRDMCGERREVIGYRLWAMDEDITRERRTAPLL